MNVFNYINTRDIAYTLLIVAFVVLGFVKIENFKNLLRNIFKHLFFSKLVIGVFASVGFTCLLTYILFKWGYWDKLFIKDTFIFAIVSTSLLFKSIEIDTFNIYFKDKIIDYLKWAYLFGFIVNFGTYNLLVEVLLAIFVVVLILSSVGMQIEQEKADDKYKKTKQIIDTILAVIVVALLAKSCISISQEPSAFFNLNNLKLLFLPLIYTIAFTPIIYVFWLNAKYEVAFLKIRLIFNHSKITYLYGSLRTILFCNINIVKLEDWLIFCLRCSAHPKNINEINKLIANYKNKTEKLEFEKSTVGINPEQAKNFLSEFGLTCKNYNFLDCSDGYGNFYDDANKSIGMFDNLIYSINGNQKAVQRILLQYTHNKYEETHKINMDEFIKCIKNLYFNIFQETITEKYIALVCAGKSFSILKNDYEIIFDKETGLNKCSHFYKILIQVKEPQEFSEFESLQISTNMELKHI